MDANGGAAGPYAGRTFIILNPTAGQDEPKKLRRLIGGAFAARSAPFDLHATAGPGDAARMAEEAARLGYRAVCVVGGDGTIAEAATGLSGTNTPLGIIPRGTANQVAHNLRVPTDVEEAIEVVISGQERALDLGQVNGRAFALLAGAGFDAAMMASATRELKDRWGFGAYIYAAVKEALAATPTRFHITADDRELEVDAVSVMVANVGELFSGFIPFRIPLSPRPTDAWQDGKLEVVVLAPRKVPEFATLLWKAAHRQFGGDDRLIHFQASEITIESEPPIAVQIDGDPAGTTPMTVSAIPSALRVLVPADD